MEIMKDSIQNKLIFFRDQRLFLGNTLDLTIFDPSGENSLCQISIENILEALSYLQPNGETPNLQTIVFDQPDLDILKVVVDKGSLFIK